MDALHFSDNDKEKKKGILIKRQLHWFDGTTKHIAMALGNSAVSLGHTESSFSVRNLSIHARWSIKELWYREDCHRSNSLGSLWKRSEWEISACWSLSSGRITHAILVVIQLTEVLPLQLQGSSFWGFSLGQEEAQSERHGKRNSSFLSFQAVPNSSRFYFAVLLSHRNSLSESLYLSVIYKPNLTPQPTNESFICFQ